MSVRWEGGEKCCSLSPLSHVHIRGREKKNATATKKLMASNLAPTVYPPFFIFTLILSVLFQPLCYFFPPPTTTLLFLSW